MYMRLSPAFLLLGSAWAQQTPFTAPQLEAESEWTVFNRTIKRVAVIGAGPAGLQAAAALVADGSFDVVRLFDRAPGPGGNWFYTEEEVPVRESYPDAPLGNSVHVPHSLPLTELLDWDDEVWRDHWLPRPVWDSLHTNSPAVITELPDVPYPDDHPWVISGHTIQAHVRAYASIHRLNVNDGDVASYTTRVERLEKSNGTWTVTLKKLDKVLALESGHTKHKLKATWWKEDFDAIVVASGPYDAPHVPNIKGLVEWSTQKAVGEADRWSVYHSRVYRTPERYTGKTVLVVGPGTSGSEIARDIEPFAKKVLTSSKKYDWDNLHPFQRRSFRRFPASTEWIPEVAEFEVPLPSGEGIKEGRIRLVNGTVIEGIDEIILATGYRRSNPFLNAIFNDTIGNIAPGPPSDIFNGNPLRNIHWTGHYIPDPTIAFTNVRPWTIGKHQSYALAKVWAGTARIPNEAELWRQYNSTRYSHFGGLFGTRPSEAIGRQYVAWLNNESLEHGGRLVAPWPVKNREIFAYYANSEWESGYISRENFTRFENLPADDWTKEGLWDEDVFW